MLKWIGGCAIAVVVVVIIVAFVAYSKYKSFTAAGGATTIGIHAPVDRVFAALANADSIPVWIGNESSVTTTAHGPLKVGDTLSVSSHTKSGAVGEQRFSWTVAEVRPNQLLVLELRGDRSSGVMAVRRDSLVTSGDSTLVIRSVVSPLMDSVKAKLRDSARGAGAGVIEMSNKLMVSGFRSQSEIELKQLKAHLGGK